MKKKDYYTMLKDFFLVSRSPYKNLTEEQMRDLSDLFHNFPDYLQRNDWKACFEYWEEVHLEKYINRYSAAGDTRFSRLLTDMKQTSINGRAGGLDK